MRNNNFSTKLLCPQTHMRNAQCKKHRIPIFIQTFCWLVPGQKGKHHSPKVTLSEYLLMQFEYASSIHLTAKAECSLKIKIQEQELGELLLPGEARDFLRRVTTRLCSNISSVSTAEDSFLIPVPPILGDLPLSVILHWLHPGLTAPHFLFYCYCCLQ